ncbi:MAG TPA: monofunctional biosynthetic peptidoglycan transglycosylase [Nitrospiraceae bacterium]|jgi:monofunctional biosynthetic peptidoglycan transglycosylase|nr:monofunctional biosynthetic peptidoglycan transglycosylase [Nitrospiraceae bacterium]
MANRRLLKGIRLVFLLLAISIPLAYFLFMPDIAKLKTDNPKKTALMEYREKEWKEKGRKYRINQVWMPLSRISPYLIKAVLIAEDDKFWKHEGFDYEAMQKAIEKDIKAKKFKVGGSTISQQLAKNLYLSPSKNPLRKIAEAVITWRMEMVLSKKRILELYLNVIEWGDEVFGVEAASKYYFGKPASELTPEEAARLAAVLPNPRRYNAAGNQRYVVNRSNLICSIMIKRGIIAPEYNEAAGEDRSPSESETRFPMLPIERQQPSE